MAVTTRLSKSGDGAESIAIVDSKTNDVIAVIETVHQKTKLKITTMLGTHLEKPNGVVIRR